MAIQHVCWECGSDVLSKDRTHLVRTLAKGTFKHYMCKGCYSKEEFERLFREWN